jgi:hypothetical protein
MYTAIEYEINYIAESFQYVSDKSGFIKMHLNKLLSEWGDMNGK